MRAVLVFACGLLGIAFVPACESSDASSRGSSGAPRADAGIDPLPVELLAAVDLDPGAGTQTLSGTWFDPVSSTLWAVKDSEPTLVPIGVGDDATVLVPRTPVSLTGRTEVAWDGEAIAMLDGDFVVVTIETAPMVERFDRSGARKEALTLPARFAAQGPGNKGIESLTIAPSGGFLFVANESALTTDGPAATKTKGTVVRILRRDLSTGQDEERAYRTEPLGAGTGGDMGVSDLAAISDSTLLVLERGYQAGYGNTVRLYRVDTSAGTDVSGVAALDPNGEVLPKELVVDLATLPSDGIGHPSTQPNPILDNYEGLAIGPRLLDGRTVVYVTSDDNAQTSQVARVLVLAVPLDGPSSSP